MPFSLRIDEGAYSGRRYVFDQPEVVLGRTPDNDVVVPDDGASRRHAKISQTGDLFQVEDLKSSNGTRVNGEPLQRPLVLREGDLIQIGQVTFKYSAHKEDPKATRIVAAADLPQWDRPATALARASAPAEGRALAVPRAAPAVPTSSELRRRWSHLSRPLQLTVMALGLVCGGGLLLEVAQKVAGRGGELIGAAQEQLFDLADKPDGHTYGLGPEVDVPVPAHAVFAFNFSEPVPGKSLLVFHCQTDAVAQPEDVEVRLNGHHLGYLPATFGESRPSDWTLERHMLLPNAENRIEFINLRHPPTPWEVFGLWMEQDSLPSGTPDQLQLEAKQEFDLAEAKFGNEQVAAANLHDAWVHYKKARLILVAMPLPPAALQNLVTERLREVGNRLDRRCHQMIFTAHQAMNTKGPDEALVALEDILNYFPKDDHPCYNRARKAIAKLE